MKGLIILATFPEPRLPLSASAYEDVLLTLTSVIMSKYENMHLWRLSLKALTTIGSSIVEFHASQKENIYNKVVDKISSLDEPCRTSIPLNLRLEACFEVGTSGSNCMLRIAKSLEEAVVGNISEATEHSSCFHSSCMSHFYKQLNKIFC